MLLIYIIAEVEVIKMNVLRQVRQIRGATQLYNFCHHNLRKHQMMVSPRRHLYTPNDAVQKQGSYEGPGKTTVAILNEDYAGVVNLIDSFAVDGFRLNDNTKILGPCVVFPTHVLGKNIQLFTHYIIS